jgi:hypothetical protein
VPKPDLLVRLNALRNIRAAQLFAHTRRQDWIDWRLEFDLETQLRSIEEMHELCQSLQQHAVPPIDVECTDTHSLDEALRELKRVVLQGEKSR